MFFLKHIEEWISLPRKHMKNCAEVTVDKIYIFWLNEKNIEEGISHVNLPAITRKYHSENIMESIDIK